MLEMISKAADLDAIESLWKETFLGRRRFIQNLSLTSLPAYFKEHCPLLREAKYVSGVVRFFVLQLLFYLIDYGSHKRWIFSWVKEPAT